MVTHRPSWDAYDLNIEIPRPKKSKFSFSHSLTNDQVALDPIQSSSLLMFRVLKVRVTSKKLDTYFATTSPWGLCHLPSSFRDLFSCNNCQSESSGYHFFFYDNAMLRSKVARSHHERGRFLNTASKTRDPFSQSQNHPDVIFSRSSAKSSTEKNSTELCEVPRVTNVLRKRQAKI